MRSSREFAPEACGMNLSTGYLGAVDAAHGVRCTWYCLAGALYCLEQSIAGYTAQRGLARGVVWEESCKLRLRARYRLTGQDVAVAGTFSGDWLPPLAEAVGADGRVFGFEPTAPAVNVSRAVAAANGLAQVVVRQRGLSAARSDLLMCVNQTSGNASYFIGDRAHVHRGASDVAKGCQVARLPCVALDDELPWRTRRVGLLLLDVEGHEEAALWGAANLTRAWRPLIASELPLHTPMRPPRPIWEALLAPLGYRHDGSCPGLQFYRAVK